MCREIHYETRIAVLAVGMLLIAGNAPAQVTIEETRTGGSTQSSFVSAANVTSVANHLYLVAVSSKLSSGVVAVSSVTGLGLNWTRVVAQCAGRSQTSIEVWKALGTPTGSGSVTANLASTPENATIAVARYSGINVLVPIGAVVSGNTKGPGDVNCTGGTDNSAYSFDIATASSGSVVYCAAATRNKSHTPGASYAERAEIHHPGSGDGTEAGLAIEDRTVASPSTVAANGMLNGSVDWAVAAIEIRRQPTHPFLYFTAAELPALRSAWQVGGSEREAIYQALRRTVDFSEASSWLSQPVPTLGGDDQAYTDFAAKMAAMAFLYVLDPTLTAHRDKALDYADKLVEIHLTRQSQNPPGVWGGTVNGVDNQIRDTGLSQSIKWMSAIYDWLYDDIPVTPLAPKIYRSKFLYTTALDGERMYMRQAIKTSQQPTWNNWWPNSWMQNHNGEDHSGFAIATWLLEAEQLLTIPSDLGLVDSAMAKIKYVWDSLTPDGVWHEGYHYQTVGMTSWINGFLVQEKAKGINNWPATYLDAFADWMVANLLDDQSRSFLIKMGDLGGNDPPVTGDPQCGGVGNRIGAQPLFLAHVGAAKAASSTQRGKYVWAVPYFKNQETCLWDRPARVSTAIDYMLEYLLYPGAVTPVTPTEKRYSFSDRHAYVWTEGYGSSDAKVASIAGGYAGDHAIDVFPAYPWDPDVSEGGINYQRLNTGHDHEDAGQYYFRKGHTELTTEYAIGGASIFTENQSAWHNALLIDPLYTGEVLNNPAQCGQFNPYLSDGGRDLTLVRTQAQTLHNRWLGPSSTSVRADYVAYDLSQRYQLPTTESQGPPTAKILTRYDRRVLWIRNAIGLGPVLFVHDEIDASQTHQYEWRHHGAVPVGGVVGQGSQPAMLSFWRLDCTDGLSLALAVAVPTSGQGADFTVDAHQHAPILSETNPPRYVRVKNSNPVANTHMGFMMFPVTTASWTWPSGYPPGVTSASFDRQNSAGVVAFDWATPGYSHAMNFMDDGAESNGPLLVDGAAHVSAAMVSLRDQNGTAAQTYLFWGRKAVDIANNRNFILLSGTSRLGDVMTETNDAGRLDIYVTAHNQNDVATLLDQALIYEHPTSTSYITSVYVNGVNIDTETPRKLYWMHEAVGGKPHIRLTKPSGGGGGGGELESSNALTASFRTALAPLFEPVSGAAIPLRYSIGIGTMVRLEIYDVGGRKIRELREGRREPGEYVATWNREDGDHARMTRGLYFVRLVAGSTTKTRKLVLVGR